MTEVYEFIMKLTRPLYVWRMANGVSQNYGTERMRKSANTRLRKAEAEIKALVVEYGERWKDHG